MMRPMNRIETWTAVVLLGVGVAFFDLFTGWTVDGSWAAGIATLGLVAVAIALYVAVLIAGRRDRKRIATLYPDPKPVLMRAARAVRWSGLFAIGFCVLLFANCSSGVSTGTLTGRVVAWRGDTPTYVSMASWLLLPLVLALLLVPVLITAAQMLATNRPQTASRLARVARWASVLAAGVAFFTVPLGFFFGVSACDFGTSAGACAAGASSLMNFLSIGSLALFLPYIPMVTWALARMEYDRANPA
jgi:hypothetical protein